MSNTPSSELLAVAAFLLERDEAFGDADVDDAERLQSARDILALLSTPEQAPGGRGEDADAVRARCEATIRHWRGGLNANLTQADVDRAEATLAGLNALQAPGAEAEAFQYDPKSGLGIVEQRRNHKVRQLFAAPAPAQGVGDWVVEQILAEAGGLNGRRSGLVRAAEIVRQALAAPLLSEAGMEGEGDSSASADLSQGGPNSHPDTEAARRELSPRMEALSRIQRECVGLTRDLVAYVDRQDTDDLDFGRGFAQSGLIGRARVLLAERALVLAASSKTIAAGVKLGGEADAG